MTNPTAVTRSTLSEQVAVRIMRSILTGTFKHGEKLPSEVELCRRLDVGRSTLREGLQSLSHMGIVDIRPGRGTVVADGSSDLLNLAFGHGLLREVKDIKDLFEARMLLETKLAALCARHATEGELQHLADIVNEMHQVLRVAPERFAQLDLEFHLAVAAGSRNRVMARLCRALAHTLYEWIQRAGQIAGSRDRALAHHQRILGALRRRSPRHAMREMRSHLENLPSPYGLLLAVSAKASVTREMRKGSGERS